MLVSIPFLGLKHKPCNKRGNFFTVSKMDMTSVPAFMLRYGVSYNGDLNGKRVTFNIHRSTISDVFFQLVN